MASMPTTARLPSVFKSYTTLVRPQDPVDPRKQDGVMNKIPCECGKVYIAGCFLVRYPLKENAGEFTININEAVITNSNMQNS